MFIYDPNTHLVVDSAKPILSKYHQPAIDKLIAISMDVDTDDAYPFFYHFHPSHPEYISNVSYSNFSQLPHLLAKNGFLCYTHPTKTTGPPNKSNSDTPRVNGPHPLLNASWTSPNTNTFLNPCSRSFHG